MLEIFGKNYVIDIDEVIQKCHPKYPDKVSHEINSEQDDEGNIILEINVFKFEIFKACIERILNEYESDVDDNLGVFVEEKASPSFKIAFNTLLKYEILIEDDNTE